MAIGSYLIAKDHRKLPKLSARLLRWEFQLPKKYPLLDFMGSIIFFTLIIEILGAIWLYYGLSSCGADNPIFLSIFHSISAFCTAGFSLFPDSMVSYNDSANVISPILTLSLLGSIGFIVFVDAKNALRKKKKITLTSKIILISTITIWLMGALLIYLSDTSFMPSAEHHIIDALAQSAFAHTTVGFNSIDIGMMDHASLFIIIILMIIGASPSGTGGGIKTTSLTAIASISRAVYKRNNHITFLGKEIPAPNLYLAITSIFTYLVVLIFTTFLILIIEKDDIEFMKLFFENCSALSTVGLSTGITAELKPLSKILVCILMFIGRIGVISIGFALTKRSPLISKKPYIEDIAI